MVGKIRHHDHAHMAVKARRYVPQVEVHPKHVVIKGKHLLIHAGLAFAEYHIVDVIFHKLAGTNATYVMMDMMGLGH